MQKKCVDFIQELVGETVYVFLSNGVKLKGEILETGLGEFKMTTEDGNGWQVVKDHAVTTIVPL